MTRRPLLLHPEIIFDVLRFSPRTVLAVPALTHGMPVAVLILVEPILPVAYASSPAKAFMVPRSLRAFLAVEIFQGWIFAVITIVRCESSRVVILPRVKGQFVLPPVHVFPVSPSRFVPHWPVTPARTIFLFNIL